MKNIAMCIGSVVGGAVVTGITGLVNATPGGLVGAAWYGWPTTWLYRLVIAPQYNPWRVHPVSLAIDLVFWIIVVHMVLAALKGMMQK